MSLGEWLGKARRDLQLSQQEVSRISGVAQTTISAMETKPAAITRKAQELRRVTEALGLSLLEAYSRAEMLQSDNERDQDAFAVAQLVVGMTEGERREILAAALRIAERKE